MFRRKNWLNESSRREHARRINALEQSLTEAWLAINLLETRWNAHVSRGIDNVHSGPTQTEPQPDQS